MEEIINSLKCTDFYRDYLGRSKIDITVLCSAVADIRKGYYSRPTEIAPEFGLKSDPEIYKELSGKEAVELLASIFHRSLAYDGKWMEKEKAYEIANGFIKLFENQNPLFFTNGDWHKRIFTPLKPGEGRAGPGWMPATESTFDAGIIILGDSQYGCIWVTDED